MFFLRSALLVSIISAAIGISGVVLLHGVVPSHAVQSPSISLDMVTAGNTYDEATNTMNVGATDNCLTSGTANANTHLHSAHIVVQNVEDLIGWQTRVNYSGDKMRPNTVSFAPFTDNNTGQNLSFVNLPIDQATSVHRDITSASNIPAAQPGAQTAAFGSSYLGTQNAGVSADTPAKSTPDDSSYSAPSGGVLAAVSIQVPAGNAGNASLFLNLDDGAPNAPGSGVSFFTGSSSQQILLDAGVLGDGYHGEGATCVPLECVTTDCPMPPVDVRNHTFTNNTSLPASDLHIRFSNGVTPRLVQNAPGCPAPAIGGDPAAGRVDIDWGTLCVDSAETVVIEITSWPPATADCAHWGVLSVPTLKNCDVPPVP